MLFVCDYYRQVLLYCACVWLLSAGVAVLRMCVITIGRCCCTAHVCDYYWQVLLYCACVWLLSAGVAVLRMCKKPVNSLDVNMLTELTSALDELESNSHCNSAIITSVCLYCPYVI